HLPAGIEITPQIPIELINHDELIERFETPSHLTLVNLKPLRGTILIVFDAPLVTWIVESRFGGTGRFPVATVNREFTADAFGMPSSRDGQSRHAVRRDRSTGQILRSGHRQTCRYDRAAHA